MSNTKKNAPVFEDPVNGKIQRQFNLVFENNNSSKAKSPNENTKIANDDELNFESQLEGDMGNESGAKKKEIEPMAATTISLDLADSDAPVPLTPADNGGTKNTALDFSLDFNLDEPIEAMPAATQAPTGAASGDETSGGFVLDDADLSMDFDERTKQTVVMNVNELQESTRVMTKEATTTAASEDATAFDLMSTAEAKANIESTIKDILRPKFENTQEINISDMALGTDIHTVEDSELDLGGNTPSKGFSLNAIAAADDFSFDEGESTRVQSSPAEVSSNEADFSLLGDDSESAETSTPEPSFSTNDEPSFSTNDEPSFSSISEPSFTADLGSLTAVTSLEALHGLGTSSSEDEDEPMESLFEAPSFSEEVTAPKVQHYSSGTKTSSKNTQSQSNESYAPGSMNTEDSMRTQATIRSLREERETLLAQIKNFKTENRELEQDNLTLKANLDEAKIEITILRKRHMVEVEDMKYRLTMSEEKKAMAEEKARQAEVQKSKLEQKVRIDFNQVKQREKELESKLELLSMDVDSQVQSRDHKILELRRKIDALEFNMENASIKEQKSLDDKRKLEDRLNKIMKTLRHSIKNLEDDIDHAVEDSDHQKDKN